LLANNVAERFITAGDCDGEVQRCPALAGLWLAGQDCQPFGNNLRHRPFWLFEFARDELGRRGK